MDKFIPASYWQRLLAGLIDAGLVITLIVIIGKQQASFSDSIFGINPTLATVLLLIIYRIPAIGFAGKTIGMQLTGIRFLDHALRSLSIKQRLLAAVFVLHKGVDYYRTKRESSSPAD